MKNTRKKNIQVKRGGFFWSKNASKSPADNVKDFDNLWIDRIDPTTGKFYEYNADTYWPGKTNPGMMPEKYTWSDGGKRTLVWRDFEQGPKEGEQIIMVSNGTVYIGKVVGVNRDGITLADGRALTSPTPTTFVTEVISTNASKWRYKGAKSLEPAPAPIPKSGNFYKAIPKEYNYQIIIVTKNGGQYSGVLKECNVVQPYGTSPYISLTLGNAYNITKQRFVAEVNGQIMEYPDKNLYKNPSFTMRAKPNDSWELLAVYKNNSGYNSDIQREFRKRHQIYDSVAFSTATPPIGSEILVYSNKGMSKYVSKYVIGNVSSIENNVLALTNACNYYADTQPDTFKCDSLGTINIEFDRYDTWIHLDELNPINQQRIKRVRPPALAPPLAPALAPAPPAPLAPLAPPLAPPAPPAPPLAPLAPPPAPAGGARRKKSRKKKTRRK